MAGDGDAVAIVGEEFPTEVAVFFSTELNSLIFGVLLIGDIVIDCKLLLTKIFELLGRFWDAFLTDVFTVDFVGCGVAVTVVKRVDMLCL